MAAAEKGLRIDDCKVMIALGCTVEWLSALGYTPEMIHAAHGRDPDALDPYKGQRPAGEVGV